MAEESKGLGHVRFKEPHRLSEVSENSSMSKAESSASQIAPKTPKDYADAVSAHSKQGIESSLFPGDDFDRLASYLRIPYPPTTQKSSTVYTPQFNFATEYNLGSPGTGYLVAHQRDSPEELGEFQDSTKESNSRRLLLLFLRGQASPEWLATVGAKYFVDPEFFNRHLDFLSTVGRLNYYTAPALPCASENVFQLRYFTVGCSDRHLTGIPKTIGEAREIASKETRQYFNDTIKKFQAGQGLGMSIVRDFIVINERHYVIEQAVTICVGRSHAGPNVVAWLDTAEDLLKGLKGPWTRYLQANASRKRDKAFLPTIQVASNVALKSRKMSIAEDRRSAWPSVQSSGLLHLNYGRTLERKLLAADPFHSLYELFQYCAFSENQFINLLDEQLSDNNKTSSTVYNNDSAELDITQANILYFKDIVERQIERLHTTVEMLERRMNEDLQLEESLQRLRYKYFETLTQNYKYLLRRAQALNSRSQSLMTLLSHRASIVESNKQIKQAEDMAKLTRLAFVFVPLSFIASFFGMNLQPIVQQGYQLWLWAAVTLPAVALSVILMKCDLSLLGRLWKRWRKGRNREKVH